jgi:hypothetical protein
MIFQVVCLGGSYFGWQKSQNEFLEDRFLPANKIQSPPLLIFCCLTAQVWIFFNLNSKELYLKIFPLK